MAHHSVTLFLLLGNRSSSDEPSVLQPYHSTDLLVLTQTTHPVVFTHLLAVSCLFGHLLALAFLLMLAYILLHSHSLYTNLNIAITDLYRYFHQRQNSYYKLHEYC